MCAKNNVKVMCLALASILVINMIDKVNIFQTIAEKLGFLMY